MVKKENVEYVNTTLAEIHAALFNTEKEFYDALKRVDMKGAIELAKRYMELNKLLLKRSDYVSKNGIIVEYPEGNPDIAKVVKEIMEENNKNIKGK